LDTHDLGPAFVHPVPLRDDAPVVHAYVTQETDHPYRASRSVIVKTRFAREGRWHGIRKSWVSVQVKLPTGPKMADAVWGIVVGWWRHTGLDEWEALLRALNQDHVPDGDDEREFTDPEFDGTNDDRGIGVIRRRRVDDPDDAGAGQ
jgi:hypothetical protein